MLFTHKGVFSIESDVTKRSDVTWKSEELKGLWDVAVRGARWPGEGGSAGAKGRVYGQALKT